MQLNIRATLAGIFLVAVAALLVHETATSIAAVPPCLWIMGVAIGALRSQGRGLRCVIFSMFGGVIGGSVASLLILVSDQMAFPAWYSPLVMIALSGLGGAVLGSIVRVIMEGVTLGNPGRVRDE